MESTTRTGKGKRGRKSSMDDMGAPVKRSRARRGERAVVAEVGEDMKSLPPTKPRHGLLTPEASGILESRTEELDVEDEVALRGKDIFPFLELPAEIRLHIYYMALVRHEPILLHAERALEKVEEEDAHTTQKGAEGEGPTMEGTPTTSSTSLSPITSSTTSPKIAHAARLRDTLPSNSNGRIFHRRSFAASSSSQDTSSSSSNSTTPTTPSIAPHDPITPLLLRLNKQIHKEARQLLYSENVFTLSLSSGIHTLSTLHQRSRSLIKHIVLTIPSHHDILDGFADLVRLGLRYCWGLKSFRIILDASLPDAPRNTAAGAGVAHSLAGGSASSVYANAFHILRWLPRGCSVVLEGSVSEQVRKVVAEEGRLMNVLDERSYLKRQHQMPERH